MALEWGMEGGSVLRERKNTSVYARVGVCTYNSSWTTHASWAEARRWEGPEGSGFGMGGEGNG